MPSSTPKLRVWPIFKRLLAMLRPYRVHVYAGVLLLLVATAIGAGSPLLLMRAIDVDLAHKDTYGLALTCAAFLGLQVVLVGLRLVQVRLLEGTAQRLTGELRVKAFAHVLALPAAYHDKNPPGKLLSRIEGDIEQLKALFSSAVVGAIGSVAMFAMLLAVMFAVDPGLACVVAGVIPLLGLGLWWFQRVIAPRYLSIRKRTADMTAECSEYLQGASIIQALRLESTVGSRFDHTNRERFKDQLGVERWIIAFWNSVFFVEALGQVAVYGYGGWRAIQEASTVGTIVLFSELLRRSFEPLHNLAHDMQSAQQALAGAQMVFDVLDEPVEGAIAPGSDLAKKAPDPVSPVELAAQLDHVWFAYAGEEWVLRDVSLAIPRGSHVAIVGATGSGKSTLVALLLRFYQPQRGTVQVRGTDVKDVPLEALRRGIGYVPQDLLLFPGTLIENLALGDVSPAAAQEAATRLGLGPLVATLPGGWDAKIAERGLNLSAGERQLLCAARALAADPPLLVLDEATSAVDPASERALQAAIARMRAGRTMVSIAHRLSTIEDADRIVVMDHGRIVEEGRHAELVALGGIYARLHELQRGTSTELAGAAR